MITNLIGIAKSCCFWFWKSNDSAIHKQASQKNYGETEDQQFMRRDVQLSKPQKRDNPQYKTQTKQPQPQPQITKSSQLINPIILTKSYMDCISPENPYFDLIRPKLQLLPTIFDIQAEPQPKIAENKYNLKIRVKQSEDERSNIFVYNFEFPTTYDFYEEMQSNYQLQRSFDNNIDLYLCQEKIDDSTKIIYLAYKKILIVSPRDFVYVRYTFKKDNQSWALAVSIPDSPKEPGKERGTIILTATRAIQKDETLYLSVYSQVDMKMPIKASAAKVRGITEIKKYLDKCYDYIQKQSHSMI